MTPPPFTVRLWGVRGSLPVSGPQAQGFGGNTICIEMRCGDHVLFFDAGTGLRPAGVALRAEGVRDATLFFSHSHYDHIMGLPFFKPLYDPQMTVTIWSGHLAGRMTTAAMVADLMRAPFFPIGPEKFAARVAMRDFVPGDVIEPCPGVVVRSAPLDHPGGSVGYRVEWGGRAVAVVTDTEHQPDVLDPGVLGLMRGADLALYDASFGDDEFTLCRGWGHSTWQHGLRLAEAAGVQRLGLIHHAEWRTDAQLADLEVTASARFKGAFCGRDGQVIEV